MRHAEMKASLALSGALLAAALALPARAEEITLDDGTTCTVIETQAGSGNGLSSTVTAGSGKVTSQTTLGQDDPSATSSTSSAGNGASASSSASSGATSSSSASSTVSGAGGGQSLSTASVRRPDGSVVTKRSDGTCAVTRANP